MAQTHFGFQNVDEADKASRVRGVFDSVAGRYDLMNDVLSMGLHRAWKAYTVVWPRCSRVGRCSTSRAAPVTSRVLLQRLPARKGRVVLSEINESMLRVGGDRLLDAGLVIPAAACDAEHLPFADASFNLVSVAFGLRNMTHKEAALQEMCRVLRPGGRLLVLEFSKPAATLQKPYDWYSSKLMPLMGKWVAQDEASYRYLAESIRMHPDQATLMAMMQGSGFGHVHVHNLAAGIVALHVGIKC